MWDLSSLTRDQVCVCALEAQSLNHWTTRDVPFHELSLGCITAHGGGSYQSHFIAGLSNWPMHQESMESRVDTHWLHPGLELLSTWGAVSLLNYNLLCVSVYLQRCFSRSLYCPWLTKDA